jgi:hypothetical protein
MQMIFLFCLVCFIFWDKYWKMIFSVVIVKVNLPAPDFLYQVFFFLTTFATFAREFFPAKGIYA